MTNNSMTKGRYSRIEKENGSNIKHKISGNHTRGRETDTLQCLNSKETLTVYSN